MYISILNISYSFGLYIYPNCNRMDDLIIPFTAMYVTSDICQIN